MRVFLAGTSFDPSYGGPAFSVAGLAESLGRAGAQVGLWAPDGSGPPENFANVRKLHGSLDDALKAFGKADVVHDNGIWRSHNHGLARMCRRIGLPRIVSVRGMLEPWAFRHKAWKKAVAWRAYQKRDLAAAAFLHATSAQEAENLGRLNLGVRIATIPNGIALPDAASIAEMRNASSPKQKKTALFLGRLYPVKGLPMLAEAWAKLRPQNWQLEIAGPDEADHRAEIERAIHANGLENDVRLTGAVAPAAKAGVYARADLFVLPSYSESFGMAIAEALAHGLPVLTTTGAPWPHLADKGCGWRVAATVEAIAQGLTQAFSCDDETLRGMGAKVRDYVERDFGWDATAKAMMDVYCAAAGA